MKAALVKLITGTPLETLARYLLNKPKVEFDTSAGYWERRYTVGGNSGAGSYGRLSRFKAEFLNDFVASNDIESVIEFGCGDGNQLELAEYKTYTGVDVARTAVEMCQKTFADDATKTFVTSADYNGQTADLALSLDVIYHLIEDEVYHQYMTTLFASARKYAIVYASNTAENDHGDDHVKHRKFTDWVVGNAPDFALVSLVPNKYPFKATNPENTSFADFYVFEKSGH